MQIDKQELSHSASTSLLEVGLTGKCLPFVEAHLQEFWRERKDDPALRRIEIEDYVGVNGVSCQQIKLLKIKGRGSLYNNKTFKIKVIFFDQYPQIPPKMYFVPSKGKTLLHANVYHDNGQICHPFLEPRAVSVKLSSILKKIEELIYQPNFNNAANLVLASKYKEDRELYQAELFQNSKTLPLCSDQSDQQSD